MKSKWSTLLCLFFMVAGITGAHAQATYGLGSATALLNQAYYDGVDANGAGASATGRLAYFASPSKDGSQVAFWMVSGDFSEVAVFVVTIGDPGSWLRVSGSLGSSPSAPIAWTPDDSHLLVGNLKFDVLTGDSEPAVYDGIALNDSSTTNLPTNNWIATLEDDVNGQEQVALIPIFPNGDLDPSREITFVTNFAFGVGPFPDWPSISPDGSRLTFADYYTISLGTADHGDIYVVDSIPAIIAAPKSSGQISSLAPVNSADTKVTAIRTTEDSVDNFAHVPHYAQDQSILFFVEDWNNLFENDNYFATLAAADFDVMLSKSDGSDSDVRFAGAGNQFITAVTPGGVRVLYLEGVGTDFHLYISSLETTTPVTGTPVGNPTDNILQAGSGQVAKDASGTAIEIEENALIDFPDGAPQAIEIFTPIDPVQAIELPPGIDGLPVVRDFGPDGTTFSIPVQVTIAYTDAEIAGLDETNLRVFRYNPATMIFDDEITTIVSRNLSGNSLTFTVDHFSTYAVGSTKGSGMPVGETLWVKGLLLALLLVTAVLVIRASPPHGAMAVGQRRL